MVGRVSYPVRGRAGGTRIGPPMKWALTCPAEVIVTQRMRQEQTMASAPPTCRLTALPRATQGSGLASSLTEGRFHPHQGAILGNKSEMGVPALGMGTQKKVIKKRSYSLFPLGVLSIKCQKSERKVRLSPARYGH